MFDFTPLSPWHLTLLGASFAATYGVMWSTVSRKLHARQHQAHPSARFVGVILIAVVTLMTAGVLRDQGLALGLLAAAIIVLVVGTLDEIHSLSPATQLIAQVISAVVVASSGWAIQQVSNPWGEGVIKLAWLPLGGALTLSALLLTVGWLVFLMNSVNWLDGADGLVGSVSLVAFSTLAAISLLPSTQDSTTLALALVGAGGIGAFVLWNWPPARVYLGTSGSWFLGLYLGLVAIIGGGKIATTLLVLAIPTIDAGLVVIQRLLHGQAPWQGDRVHHLHFRLRALGLRPAAIALLATIISVFCGIAAVLLQTQQKILFLLIVGVIMAAVTLLLWMHQKNTSRASHSPPSQ